MCLSHGSLPVCVVRIIYLQNQQLQYFPQLTTKKLFSKLTSECRRSRFHSIIISFQCCQENAFFLFHRQNFLQIIKGEFTDDDDFDLCARTDYHCNYNRANDYSYSLKFENLADVGKQVSQDIILQS